jgi:AmmeMemoRadiSam system protein A
MAIGLTDNDKRFLLRLARSVISSKAKGETFIQPVGGGSQALESLAGVFVSLHIKGTLRGCVGFLKPDKSLIGGVVKSAENAAFADSRFPPVKVEEIDGIEIEISLLSPPVPVASFKQIELGKHGIILEKQGARALFLPQVPTEYGWDLAKTLSQLSRKAGLAPDAWKTGARFQVFESLIFGEEDL